MAALPPNRLGTHLNLLRTEDKIKLHTFYAHSLLLHKINDTLVEKKSHFS